MSSISAELDEFFRKAGEHPSQRNPAPPSTARSVNIDVMVEWLIANPGPGAISKCAKALGVNPSWVSRITQSDFFKVRTEKRLDKLRSDCTDSIRERMENITLVGLEKLGSALDKADVDLHRDFIADTTFKASRALGMGAKAQAAPTTVNISVNNGELRAARDRLMNQGQSNALSNPFREDLLQAPEIPSRAELEMGEVQRESAKVFPRAESANGKESSGD
jgi:hypothetical protein